MLALGAKNHKFIPEDRLKHYKLVGSWPYKMARARTNISTPHYPHG